MTRWPASAQVRIPAHVVHRSIGEQLVVLNLQSGVYHGLNGSGQRMFELLAGGGTLEGVAAHLAEEYDHPEQEVAADLAELCAELSERGLLELDAGR